MKRFNFRVTHRPPPATAEGVLVTIHSLDPQFRIYIVWNSVWVPLWWPQRREMKRRRTGEGYTV